LKKTKTGVSTDESVLKRLSDYHEMPSLILEYRELNKLKSTYYDAIYNMSQKTKKVHTSFNQAVTATGRLSSSDPNLQNIPVRTPLGREVRKAFICASKDKCLLAADYSQIELRILAHLSGDKNLISAFKSDKDVHVFTASLVYDVDESEVTKEMRQAAKTVNFGIIYGMSSFRLAKDLGISVKDAQEFIDAYFDRYPGVKDFMEDVVEGTRSKGFVKTLLGRIRYMPEIDSKNHQIRSFAERAAINTPVQGTAADIIKLAMLSCFDIEKDFSSKMLLQVHDELIFEVSKSDVDALCKKVKQQMESVIELKVPLKVDLKKGQNWLEMERIDVSD